MGPTMRSSLSCLLLATITVYKRCSAHLCPARMQSLSYARALDQRPSSTHHRLMMCTGADRQQPAFKTLAPGSHMAELDPIKKSRFIGYAQHVNSWSQAQDFIAAVRNENPKARHSCYACCCGINPVNERSSDDGEPSGTAGSPILNAIHGEALSDTVCVVVRYSGGIKLGAGGLIRAYGGAARHVLRQAPEEVLVPRCAFGVTVQVQHIGAVYESMAKVDGSTSDEEYGVDGRVTIALVCDSSQEELVRRRLNDVTRGSAEFS